MNGDMIPTRDLYWPVAPAAPRFSQLLLERFLVDSRHPLARHGPARQLDKQSKSDSARLLRRVAGTAAWRSASSNAIRHSRCRLSRPVMELAIEPERDLATGAVVDDRGCRGKATAGGSQEARTPLDGYHAVLLFPAALKGCQRSRTDRALHGDRPER